MPLDTQDISQIRSLINEELAIIDPRARVYDRIPQGQEGLEGEFRNVSLGDRVFLFHKVNKRWWMRESGSPRITRWEDLKTPFSSARLPASGAPTWTAYKSSQILSFSASATNTVHFAVKLPHGRQDGSKIYPHVHWVPATTNVGNVYFRLTYSWANVHGVFASATTSNILTASGGVADKHLIAPFPPIDGLDKTLSSMLLCSFSRVGGDGTDTFTGVSYFLGFDFHILRDDIGSIDEYKKEIIRIGR